MVHIYDIIVLEPSMPFYVTNVTVTLNPISKFQKKKWKWEIKLN